MGEDEIMKKTAINAQKIPVKRNFTITAEDNSIDIKNAEESFRQGWKEALEGDTYPISELWDGIDAE
jgi:hypothetical protein